jgi:hypothetical protein
MGTVGDVRHLKEAQKWPALQPRGSRGRPVMLLRPTAIRAGPFRARPAPRHLSPSLSADADAFCPIARIHYSHHRLAVQQIGVALRLGALGPVWYDRAFPFISESRWSSFGRNP